MGDPQILVEQQESLAERVNAELHIVPNALYLVYKFGGPYRDRTDDLLNANQALSQLS